MQNYLHFIAYLPSSSSWLTRCQLFTPNFPPCWHTKWSRSTLISYRSSTWSTNGGATLTPCALSPSLAVDTLSHRTIAACRGRQPKDRSRPISARREPSRRTTPTQPTIKGEDITHSISGLRPVTFALSFVFPFSFCSSFACTCNCNS
uniref:Uncharacterized protein n=1 Tax=Caenorhabditis japonica TaxID=281687 RepID=A0A8R1EDU2_CAEJA